MATARSERERRLSLLPGAASIEWGELTPILRKGQVDKMWTEGIHIVDGGSIMVRLTYPVALYVGATPGNRVGCEHAAGTA